MSTTADPPQSRIEIMRAFVPASPLVQRLGIELTRLEPDHAELRLPDDARNVTLDDVVHGGAIASLIDTAGMASTWATHEPTPNLRGSTIMLSVEYLDAARGNDLTAVSRCIRRGRSVCFNDVLVTEPDGRAVARGSLVQRLG